MNRIDIYILALFLSASALSIAADSTVVNTPDPSATFSTADTLMTSATDSLQVSEEDSVILYNPSPRHGAFSLMANEADYNINKRDFLLLDYTGLNDIMCQSLPVYPLLLGSFMQNGSYSAFGAPGNAISIAYSGRPMNDPEYASYNLNQFPSEFVENVEIFTGSEAIVFGGTPTFINLQEIRYNTAKPFTRLFYTQAGFENINADGLISQNFAPNMNFTFGFRHQGSEPEYPNSFSENWNVRGKLRWALSDVSSVSIAHSFTNHGNGTSGGYKNDNYRFDAIQAEPNYTLLTEKVFRHDLTANYTTLLADSMASLSLLTYLSNSEWSYNLSDGTYASQDTNTIDRHKSVFYGAGARYEQRLLNIFLLRTGANIDITDIGRSRYFGPLSGPRTSIYGHGVINPQGNFRISGGARLMSNQTGRSLSFGAKALLLMGEAWSASADLSLFSTVPSHIVTENGPGENQTTTLGILSLRHKIAESELIINAFANLSTDVIFAGEQSESILPDVSFKIYDNYDVFGATVNYRKRFNSGALFWDAAGVEAFGQWNMCTLDGEQVKYLPTAYAGASGYIELQRGSSIMRLGLRSMLLTGYTGMNYIPLFRAYQPVDYEAGTISEGITLFVVARLGNAYVRLTYENLMSMNYYYVPLYPMRSGNLRLTVSWSFETH